MRGNSALIYLAGDSPLACWCKRLDSMAYILAWACEGRIVELDFVRLRLQFHAKNINGVLRLESKEHPGMLARFHIAKLVIQILGRRVFSEVRAFMLGQDGAFFFFKAPRV